MYDLSIIDLYLALFYNYTYIESGLTLNGYKKDQM